MRHAVSIRAQLVLRGHRRRDTALGVAAQLHGLGVVVTPAENFQFHSVTVLTVRAKAALLKNVPPKKALEQPRALSISPECESDRSCTC